MCLWTTLTVHGVQVLPDMPLLVWRNGVDGALMAPQVWEWEMHLGDTFSHSLELTM